MRARASGDREDEGGQQATPQPGGALGAQDGQQRAQEAVGLLGVLVGLHADRDGRRRQRHSAAHSSAARAPARVEVGGGHWLLRPKTETPTPRKRTGLDCALLGRRLASELGCPAHISPHFFSHHSFLTLNVWHTHMSQ